MQSVYSACISKRCNNHVGLRGVTEEHCYGNSSNSDGPTVEKEVQSSLKNETINRELPEMDWILAIDVRVVLVIASLVIGYRDLILILKESPVLLGAISTEHWTSLSLLCVRDQAMKRDEVNSEIISETMCSLNFTTFEIKALNTSKFMRRDGHQTQAPMYSWIIDSAG
ncbi:hypothetical protein COOONC_00107 [Cooperia oncophora]